MAPEPLPRAEVLVLQTHGRVLAPLIHGLRQRGIHVDLAAGLTDLRDKFLRAGGHDALILSPDLPRMLCARAVATVTAVDPRLLVVTFTEEGAALPARRPLRLHCLHPASPLACGAVVRALVLRAVL